MKKLRLALIWGGEGREHEVSRMGARNLLSLLDRNRLTVYPVYIDKKGIWHGEGERGARVSLCRTGKRGALVREGGERIPIDVAFPLLHGDLGEDGRVQGALECAHIPYVGCDVTAGAVAADKILTKRIAESLGIPTAASVYLTKKSSPDEARRLCEENVGYPMFLKPAGLGSSVGCSLVGSPDEFEEALTAASAHNGRVLAEEYLEGVREIECSYSETSRFGEILAPPGEVSAHGVYTYRAKYGGDSAVRLIPRANLPRDTAALAVEYSRALVSVLGIRQIARVDYFLHEGRLLFNEINTMPGFTSGSLYSAMLKEHGIPTSELLTALVTDAYDRRF